MAKEEITTNTNNPLFLKEIDLLLIGKTGNGKSATGNTILGQSKFISEDSCQSVTRQVDYEVVEFENRSVEVVDGPGIGDTYYMNNVKKAKMVVMDTMQNAVLLNPDGYHAFLIVISFSVKMPKGKLKPEDEEWIIRNYVQLKENIDTNDIVDFLYQETVINRDQIEEINNGNSQSKKCEILLNIIMKSGPGDAFDKFIMSLINKDQYSHLDIVKEKYLSLQLRGASNAETPKDTRSNYNNRKLGKQDAESFQSDDEDFEYINHDDLRQNPQYQSSIQQSYATSGDFYIIAEDNNRDDLKKEADSKEKVLSYDSPEETEYETSFSESVKSSEFLTIQDETQRIRHELKAGDCEFTSPKENKKFRYVVKEDINQSSSSVDFSSNNTTGRETLTRETIEAARPAIEENDVGDFSGLFEADLDLIDSPMLNSEQKIEKEGLIRKCLSKVYNCGKGFLSMSKVGDIDVLLLGKTGNGKSATGNTILQDEVFECTDNSTSATQHVQHGYVQYNNRTIKVVDCPGIVDTGNMGDLEKTTSYLIEKMGDAVTQHPDGYHAFLLVVRYGSRFTDEDKFVITTLKSIFGEKIISQFSILLMTHGDIFHNRNKTKKKFKQWCTEQTGVLKELMEECGNRVVLFDNVTVDQKKYDSQMKKLIQTIDNLQSRGMRYNHEYFQRALDNREYLLVAAKEQRILEETNKECNTITCELEKLDNDFSDQGIEKLKCLQERAKEIKCKVQTEDNNTGALIKALEVSDYLLKMIHNRLQVILAFRQKESDLKEERTHLLKLHEEKINNLIESYEDKRAKDAQRLETERKEMEKKWLEQEEKMHANLKRILDNVESQKNDYQRRKEELERERHESKAESKSQVEESMAELQSSINELKERESKEKQALQEELIRMKILQQEELEKYNKKNEEEFKKMKESFSEEKQKLNDNHENEIQILKDKEETLIQEKQEINDELQKLKAEHLKKTGTLGRRVLHLCALM